MAPNFQAFFSYAHHDAETNPEIVKAFTSELENHVNAKVINATFSIWRDSHGLRTGDRWDAKLQEAVSTSDILIVLLTPKWLSSDYCRKEFAIFEQAEAKNAIGNFIAPILARSLQSQLPFLNDEQAEVYERLRDRQSIDALVKDFLTLAENERKILVDTLADDIAGMIDRLRLESAVSTTQIRKTPRARPSRPLDSAAHNFAEVDFVRSMDVVLDKAMGGNPRKVLAQLALFERLYVASKSARLQFGIRRAILSLRTSRGDLHKVERLKAGVENCYYVSLHEAPDAVSVCIDPMPGKPTITDLALPPDPGENYLSTVATAPHDAAIHEISAELRVSFNAEGLFVTDEKARSIPLKAQTHLKAIMEVAATKAARQGDKITPDGLLRRTIPVEDRS